MSFTPYTYAVHQSLCCISYLQQYNNGHYCSYHYTLDFIVLHILIVLIVRTSYCLTRTFLLSTLSCCSVCRYSLFPVVYCPMCRTIAWTCISSVACTPWYCSSLNCSARLVAYFSFNPLVLSTALPNILSLLYLLDTCCVSHTHLANTM